MSYNANNLQNLINNRQYAEAIAYIDKYDYPDPSYNIEMQNVRQQLQRELDLYNANISKYGNNISLANNYYDQDILTNYKALKSLRYAKNENGNYYNFTDNDFAKSHPMASEAYNYLNADDGDGIVIEMSNNKKNWFGFNQWTVNNIEEVTKRLNCSESDLIANGIEIERSDNSTKFIVPKTSDLFGSMFFIAGQIDVDNDWDLSENKSKIYRFIDNNGKKEYNYITSPAAKNINIGKDDDKLEFRSRGSLQKPYSLKEAKEQQIKKYNEDYMTKIATDYYNFIQNSEQQSKGDINKFNSEIEDYTELTVAPFSFINSKTQKQAVFELQHYLGAGRSENWAYAKNSEPLIGKNQMDDPEDQIELWDNFVSKYNAIVSKGQWYRIQIDFGHDKHNDTQGVYISLHPNMDKDDKKANDDIERIFIPNCCPNWLALESKNRTDIKANKVIYDMEYYGNHYKHTFIDGSKAFIQNGIYYKTDNDGNIIPYSKNEITKQIQTDYIINDTKIQALNFVDQNGNISSNTINTLLENITYNAALEVINKNPLYDIDGNILSKEDIFKYRETIQNNINSYNDEVKTKLEYIYNLYDNIFKELFNKFNFI